MFDTIILLCGEAELEVLPHVLLGHNSQLTVMLVRSPADFAQFDPALLRQARLVAFTTAIIVPP